MGRLKCLLGNRDMNSDHQNLFKTKTTMKTRCGCNVCQPRDGKTETGPHEHPGQQSSQSRSSRLNEREEVGGVRQRPEIETESLLKTVRWRA